MTQLVINITHLGKDYKLKAHQFAYYLVYGKVVDCIDHINNIRDDNRIDNLRSITKQQNGFNTKSKGYSYNKKLSKYRAYITIDQKQIHLGYFNIEEEARQAYTDAKKIYHII